MLMAQQYGFNLFFWLNTGHEAGHESHKEYIFLLIEIGPLTLRFDTVKLSFF